LESLAHSTAFLIAKPFGIEELGEIVREMLDQDTAKKADD